MPRSRRKEGASPSDDYGWRWGEAVEVRKNIVEQLKEYQKEKVVRQRRKEELEERIKLEDHGDYGDSNEEEDELTIARRESIRSRHEWEERQRQKARTGQDSVYEPGGGSSSASHLFRSFSVRKPGRSEREHRWTNFDSPRAKLANMDPVLERSKSSKQPKLTTSFLKNAKAKLGRSISKLILHEALPARIAESPFLPHVLQVAVEIGKSIKGPSAYEVTRVYLDEEYKEIQEWVHGFKPIGKERGVNLMCDGWKGTRNQHIINFLVYSPRGAELLRPGITRFATNFIALESIVRSKQALKEMVTSSEWKISTYTRRTAGQDMMKVIDSNQFWKKAADVLKIQEPLVKVLKMCDGYYLNPQFLYGANSSNEVLSETMARVRNVIQRIEPSMNDQILAMNHLLLYRDKVDSFETPLAQAENLKTNLDEETQGGDIDDISHEESVQLSTSSSSGGGGGGDETFPSNDDASYDTHNVMHFSHGMESDQNQGTDEIGDALDVARHSFGGE
ncbi:hypothetical protein GQ457_12G017290 [Hibiscus cannabinus]